MKDITGMLRSFSRIEEPKRDWFDPIVWGSPEGTSATLERFCILGPYPTRDFCQKVRDLLKPQDVLLVVDEACNREEVKRIKEVFSENKILVRYASCHCSGIVHAKVYLAEWRRLRGAKPSTTLAWGSRNASRNGFELNAEALSFAHLGQEEEKRLLSYFDFLWNHRSGRVKSMSCRLAGKIILHLPSFNFSSHDQPDTFDGWIQSGRLCHKYEPDPGFARLIVTLNNPLPPDAIEKAFFDVGLGQEADTNTFRFPYVQEIPESQKESDQKWRAKYFIETSLGHWTSEDCYRCHGSAFSAQREDVRRKILDQIKESSDSDHRRWIAEFVDRLRKVSTKLQKLREKPSNFFKMRGNSLWLAPILCTRRCESRINRYRRVLGTT